MNIIDRDLKFMSDMSHGNKANNIVLHHAASSNCSIEEIHYWHLQKGWSGCGYHFFVRKDGSIYKGREENIVGSHCKNHNTNSIGICAEGDYSKEEMPGIQKEAIVEVCEYLMGKYEIENIYGHKELGVTECPGGNYPLAEIKEKVKDNVKLGSSYPGYLIKKDSHKFDWNVVKIQRHLVELGYDVGACGADGYFGGDTEKAVREFQGDVGIDVDGVVGKISWGKLFG
ncbi:peptidoglycan recognition protein family protein [Clostridium grantii]|uniref:Putative peptidoglycan binding domain-containing protein n=1 Tax=Clostridium grantii DSM 8605 TaxID=1121316 RepID=A0A1M5RF13_9CLOT|nr:N-acetylmuramoyl-L-alanine amidase [Clostridium grantii]SHH24363.1 Putative peptidoglycan binding domain-containing protein [Clostridium grantii DSM 8605]